MSALAAAVADITIEESSKASQTTESAEAAAARKAKNKAKKAKQRAKKKAAKKRSAAAAASERSGFVLRASRADAGKGRGQGLFANQDLAIGDVVARAQPALSTVCAPAQKHFCLLLQRLLCFSIR